MPKHSISTAEQLFWGNSAINGLQRGIPLSPVTYVDLGTPTAISTTALINGATTTNMPNAGTKTYTFPSAGAAPQNGTLGATGTLDVARNLVVTMTHASAVVACTVIISGTDVYGQAMTELSTITAGTTSKTVTGKKAWKQVSSIAITSASDATANTCNIGYGDTLGLPYNLARTDQALLFIDGVPQTTLGTLTVADTTSPATNATGDTRGTWLPNTATNGTHSYCVWMIRVRNSSNLPGANSAYGVTQA